MFIDVNLTVVSIQDGFLACLRLLQQGGFQCHLVNRFHDCRMVGDFTSATQRGGVFIPHHDLVLSVHVDAQLGHQVHANDEIIGQVLAAVSVIHMCHPSDDLFVIQFREPKVYHGLALGRKGASQGPPHGFRWSFVFAQLAFGHKLSEHQCGTGASVEQCADWNNVSIVCPYVHYDFCSVVLSLCSLGAPIRVERVQFLTKLFTNTVKCGST